MIMAGVFPRIALLFATLFTINGLVAQTDFTTTTTWVSSSTVTNATSPIYSNANCSGIQYTISSSSSLGFQYENAVNGTGVMFPGSVGNDNIIHITFSFNTPVQDLSMHIIDLDEDNHNDGGTAEEYLYNFSNPPSSVTNYTAHPIYLNQNQITPYDGNNLTQNNNSTGWINWSGNVTSISFDYYRDGSSYEFLIDSLTFSCPCPDPITHFQTIETCPSEVLVLNSTFTGDSSFWNTGASTPSISTSQTGTYWVKTFTGNCWNIDSFQVTNMSIPALELGNTVFLCEEEDTLFTIPSAFETVSWQNGNTNYSFLAETTQTLFVTATYSTCVLEDSVQVVVSSYPIQDTLSLIEICDLTSTTLETACYSCENNWSTGASSPSISIENQAWYWVDMNNLGCITRDSVYLALKPLPVITPLEDTLICLGEQAYFEAETTNSLTYFSWSNGSSENYFSTDEAGTYSLTATLDGCSINDSFSVTFYPLLAENVSYDSLIKKCEGQSILIGAEILAPNISILWSEGSNTPYIPTNEAGTYEFTISTPCESFKGQIIVEEEECYCSVYIPNAFTPDGDEHNNVFKVEYDCPFDSFELSIFNRWGELLYKSVNPDDYWDGTYKSQPVQDGVYVYKVIYTSSSTPTWEEKTGHVNVLR